MTKSPIRKRFLTSLSVAAAGIGVLAAGYAGTPAAWVSLLELLGFLAVAVIAARACPSLDDLSAPYRPSEPSEQDPS